MKKLVSRPSKILRLVIYITTSLAVFYVALYVLGGHFRGDVPVHHAPEFEMVGQDELPDFPTPIVVEDAHGQLKWTVSIPHDYDFPLSPPEYSDMLEHCREASLQSKGLQAQGRSTLRDHLAALPNYVATVPDPNFIDITEAEQAGLLPSTHAFSDDDKGHFVGIKQSASQQTCKSSITYVLESSDAGLGQSIMRLWTVYGLAKALGKPFFIDDSRWGYGLYSDIFGSVPDPGCKPPPRHHMLPCPAEARHLVVSSVNANQMVPALAATINGKTADTDSEQQFLELARSGYQDLFKLNGPDQEYVDKRVVTLRAKSKSQSVPIVGLHIRHGDRHPLEYQYRETYIPAEVYISKAHDLVGEQHSHKFGHKESEPIVLLASDDPMTYEDAELTGALPAQDRIRLATKEAIEEAYQDPHFLHSFVDESFGWEGGFFAPMFWNLGRKTKNNAGDGPTGASPNDADVEVVSKTEPSAQAMRLRSLMGRAYMMDLAVLSKASDQVVCAVSAMGCRLLGVMLGWDEGMSGGRWQNVDGEYGWMGFDS